MASAAAASAAAASAAAEARSGRWDRSSQCLPEDRVGRTLAVLRPFRRVFRRRFDSIGPDRHGERMSDQVADGVFAARGTDVNWVLVRDGTDLTLIDAGYPGDTAAVVASIREIGSRPEDVRAILLTHAHVDHIGAANQFHDAYGTPVYTDAIEVAHAHRDYLEQASPMDVAKRAWRPGVLAWSLRITRAGATRHVAVPSAQRFPASGALDLPGRPVPVATHGHTSGHSAYYLPEAGAVVTGDALVTAHPTSSRRGPQLLAGWFNQSSSQARAALEDLGRLDAELLLPGHGDPWRGPMSAAVQGALAW